MTSIDPISPIFMGRWQPWHLGHHHVAMALIEEFGELTIGVVNPDPLRPTERYDRFHPRVNPFSYWQRVRVIQAAFAAESLSAAVAARILTVPIWGMATRFQREQLFLPPAERQLWVISDVREDSIDKIEILQRSDRRVRVLRGLPYMVQSVSATRIRAMIEADDPNWRSLVPGGAISVLSHPDYRQAIHDAKDRTWPTYLDGGN